MVTIKREVPNDSGPSAQSESDVPGVSTTTTQSQSPLQASASTSEGHAGQKRAAVRIEDDNDTHKEKKPYSPEHHGKPISPFRARIIEYHAKEAKKKYTASLINAGLLKPNSTMDMEGQRKLAGQLKQKQLESRLRAQERYGVAYKVTPSDMSFEFGIQQDKTEIPNAFRLGLTRGDLASDGQFDYGSALAYERKLQSIHMNPNNHVWPPYTSQKEEVLSSADRELRLNNEIQFLRHRLRQPCKNCGEPVQDNIDIGSRFPASSSSNNAVASSSSSSGAGPSKPFRIEVEHPENEDFEMEDDDDSEEENCNQHDLAEYEKQMLALEQGENMLMQENMENDKSKDGSSITDYNLQQQLIEQRNRMRFNEARMRADGQPPMDYQAQLMLLEEQNTIRLLAKEKAAAGAAAPPPPPPQPHPVQHRLQEHQMLCMLLEQQNKKRAQMENQGLVPPPPPPPPPPPAAPPLDYPTQLASLEEQNRQRLQRQEQESTAATHLPARSQHALQDYQTQLLLLDEHNKKKAQLEIQKQEEEDDMLDSSSTGTVETLPEDQSNPTIPEHHEDHQFETEGKRKLQLLPPQGNYALKDYLEQVNLLDARNKKYDQSEQTMNEILHLPPPSSIPAPSIYSQNPFNGSSVGGEKERKSAAQLDYERQLELLDEQNAKSAERMESRRRGMERRTPLAPAQVPGPALAPMQENIPMMLEHNGPRLRDYEVQLRMLEEQNVLRLRMARRGGRWADKQGSMAQEGNQ